MNTLHDNLLRLTEIINSQESIKLYADEVFKLRTALANHLTNHEKIYISSEIKNKVQKEARAAWSSTKWGAIIMATGSGKSKIAVEEACDLITKDINIWPDILIVVPTEKLRDENWKEEFEKWGFIDSWDHIQRCCYASLDNYKDQTFDLVILDEGHNITINNSVFFYQNKIKSCMLLTATKPNDQTKKNILSSLKILPYYELALDQSVKLGLVAPYDITIINMTLDNIDKYIEGGSKKNRFFQTEKGQYDYLSGLLRAFPSKQGFLHRMRFIYNLKSKTQAAQMILEYVIPKELRTLIFCGSKEQAIRVCDRRFFSRSVLKKLAEPATPVKRNRYAADLIKHKNIMNHYEADKGYNDFKEEKINRLSCVNALNEGENITNLDVGFIVQLTSNELDLIQRTGRFIRYRPDHIGKIIILCVEDSVDKEWVDKALKNFNPASITKIELSRLRMGIETISF